MDGPGATTTCAMAEWCATGSRRQSSARGGEPPARPAGPGSGGRHMRVFLCQLSEASDAPGRGPRDECHVGKDLLARAIAPAPAR